MIKKLRTNGKLSSSEVTASRSMLQIRSHACLGRSVSLREYWPRKHHQYYYKIPLSVAILTALPCAFTAYNEELTLQEFNLSCIYIMSGLPVRHDCWVKIIPIFPTATSRAMSATPIPQERRKQIVKVIFISLLLDLVSMIASLSYWPPCPCSHLSI